MATATLLCILTVLGGCYLFLYLAGRQMEFERKDRWIRQWYKQQEAEEEAERTRAAAELARKAVPTFTAAPPPPMPPGLANTPRPTETAASR